MSLSEDLEDHQGNVDTAFKVCVPSIKVGARLDRFLTDALAEQVDGLSRNRIQSLLAHACVRLDNTVVIEAKKKVSEGEIYTVSIPPPEPAIPQPQDIPLEIAYEDDDVIVVNKPAGMVVHPAAGNPDKTLVNAMLAHCGESLSGIGGVARPGIVHRLDKDTSGLIIVAKNEVSHASLSQQFADHSIERSYRALVWGVPNPLSGKIEGNIGRSPHNRKKMAIVSRGGKYAITNYKVLETFNTAAALVECRLETGRTHQIRVHMASLGHSIMGDPVYGSGERRVLRENTALKDTLKIYNYQALHALILGFKHPKTGKTIKLKSELPNNFNRLIDSLQEG